MRSENWPCTEAPQILWDMDLGWSHDIWRFLSLCWDFTLNTVMYFKIPPSWRLPIFLKTSMIYFSLFPPLVSLLLVFNESRSVKSNSLRPHGLYSPGNSPGQNTGMGSHSLLQVIFPTQGSNQDPRTTGGFFISWATREAQMTKAALLMQLLMYMCLITVPNYMTKNW